MKRKFVSLVSVDSIQVIHIHSTGFHAIQTIARSVILDIPLVSLCIGPPLWEHTHGHVLSPNGVSTTLDRLPNCDTVRQIETTIGEVVSITFTYQGVGG